MKVLLVDGYNVIRSTPPYRDIAEVDLSAAREALVSDVAAYAHGEWSATLVFDGGANPHSTGEAHHIAGITVIFSMFGTTADTVIEALSRKAKAVGHPVEVVTSDAATQWAVLGGGAVRRSSAEFARELRAGESEWQQSNPSGSAASRIEDRIDPTVRGLLARWARGE